MKYKCIKELILNFVDSKDIKDHLKKINYKFSVRDAACLVFNSKERTLNEKISAFEVLTKNMLGCSGIDGEKESAIYLKGLRGLIEIYEMMKRNFYNGSGDVVYCIESLHIDKNKAPHWVDSGELFADLESAIKFCEDAHVPGLRIRILKKCIGSISDPAGGCLFAILNSDFDIIDFDGSFDFLENLPSEYLSIFRDMRISIPTPFKRGDILIDKYNLVDHSLNKPFILDSVYAGNEDKYRESKFMSYRGLYVDTYNDLSPILNDFNGNNYLYLEKYEGELHGYDKLLDVYKKHGLSTDPESGEYKLPSERFYDFQNALMDLSKQIS